MQNAIRQLRRERGLSQGALAAAAGTTVAYLGFIERHGHLPGSDLRGRIAGALGVTESEVWPGTGTSEPPAEGDRQWIAS
ncbi:MAG: helix-turn-helix domain-containing protein [Anaerolineae bacterium]